ncbi:tetratricopeptide repeat protein [Mangrovivirga sp. M17]|uniref:Tetratricopeptide repeat protein n=1 Tax=Mangrovivirga halotolerans TaxID=2993936 RepID=A0ABT3RLT5_9BACT|nr:tetratricopeptide repeat protein [Mangrovivirga halotolerans]MCX2742778.1 tetratricopeptide repeat protein [Mangrovivirga halotolerans]
MKRLFIFLGIFLCLEVLDASPKLDSIAYILENKPLSLEKRAEILVKYGELLNDSDPSQAIDINKKAIDISRKAENDIFLTNALRALGISYINIGLYEQGLSQTINSLNLAQKINYYDGVIKAYNNIGVVYMYLNQYDDAEKNYKNLKQFLKEDDSDNWRNYYMNLGIVYWKKENFKQALAAYNEALGISIDKGDKRECAIIYHNLGTLYLDKNEFKKSLEYYNRALTINKKLKNEAQIPSILISIGKAHFNSGNFCLAEENILSAIEIASEKKMLHIEELGYKSLYKLYKKTGNSDKALLAFEKHIVLKDSLLTRDNSFKISQLKSNYASIQESHENEVLKKESELQESVIKYQTIIIFATLSCLVILIIASFVLLRFNRLRKQANLELLKSNHQILQQKEQLDEQSNKLIKAYQEISLMNINLEKEVLMRTEKVKSQNKTILKYSFMNAHKIRGPLARVIGLINLMNDKNDNKDYDIIIPMLVKEVKELEFVVKSIRDLLEKEELKEVS